MVSVAIDLESGDVTSVSVRPVTDEDETPCDVIVNVESDGEQPDELYDQAQQIVDAAAPFELRGWWAPGSAQRWAPALAGTGSKESAEDPDTVKLGKPPAKVVGKPHPYAAAFADVLPEAHCQALRDAAIVYLDECFSALAEGEPGQSYADTVIGSYLPRRYEHSAKAAHTGFSFFTAP